MSGWSSLPLSYRHSLFAQLHANHLRCTLVAAPLTVARFTLITGSLKHRVRLVTVAVMQFVWQSRVSSRQPCTAVRASVFRVDIELLMGLGQGCNLHVPSVIRRSLLGLPRLIGALGESNPSGHSLSH